MAALSAAIEEAAGYKALELEVEAAVALRERWERRAVAVSRLDSIIAEARDPVSSLCLPGRGIWLRRTGKIVTRCLSWPQVRAPLDCALEKAGAAEAQAVLSDRAARIEAAIEAARSTNISVARAKRLQKELQAQAAAAAASLVLGRAVAEAAMALQPAAGHTSQLQVVPNAELASCFSPVPQLKQSCHLSRSCLTRTADCVSRSSHTMHEMRLWCPS